MKKPLFWTLKRDTYGSEFHPMAVTSTNRSASRYWGRNHRDEATNTRAIDCCGRFGTEDEATAMRGRINEISSEYRNRMAIHREAIATLERDKEAAIKQALSPA